MPLTISSAGITNLNLAAGSVITNVVSANSAAYNVTNNSTWLDLGPGSLTITPTKTGNRIIVTAQYVYPKVTSNFMNVNAYRLVYGNTIVNTCSESFCYSDPYTHQHMTGQGFAQHVFTVVAAEVGVPQKVAIQWFSGNGAFAIGSFLSTVQDIAVRVTAWESA